MRCRDVLARDRAVHVTVPDLTGPPVSFSVAANPAENDLPDLAGLGDVVNAPAVSFKVVSTLYG